MKMNYKESIRLLTSKDIQKINPGLDRISKILEIIGNPQNKLRIIHTAGTNGKGSVCAVLANILKHSGYKTGLYTSPHLLDYTERIQINGSQISKEDFARLLQEIYHISKINGIYLTEFEMLTACAFKYFADCRIDFAVIETGMGGRLDASNTVKNPLCSVITSISKDHTGILGNSIEKIAFEKAGIIKEGSAAIVSSANKGYEIIKQEALKKNAELITSCTDAEICFENGINYVFFEGNKFEFPLLGLYQKQNLALVFETVKYLKRHGFKISLTEGLKTAEWRARLQYIKEKHLLIDGAHNPDAARELRKSLDYYFPQGKRIFIYGTIDTKDYKTIAETLFRPEDEIYYCEFEHNNAVSFERFKNDTPFLKNLFRYNNGTLNRKELKILTGSLYMIGYFLKQEKCRLN